MPATTKSVRKTTKERRDELSALIKMEGQCALKPCDLCARNKRECIVGGKRSDKCSECIRRAVSGCNAMPCMLLSCFCCFDVVSGADGGSRKRRPRVEVVETRHKDSSTKDGCGLLGSGASSLSNH
jgi:hypothetical protein